MPAKKGRKIIDINPQYLVLNPAVQTVVNTIKEVETMTPVVMSTYEGRALVMEILKTEIYLDNPDLVNVQQTSVTVHIAKKGAIGSLSAQKDTVAEAQQGAMVIDTAATDGTLAVAFGRNPIVQDHTDGNGNGMIYANKSVWLQCMSSQCTNLKLATARILYRLIEVGAEELIGFIQE